jgi:hypothetical protein
MKPISVGADVLQSASWLARWFIGAVSNFVRQPIAIAMRVHNAVFGVLLIAFVLVEAWGFARTILRPALFR